MSGVCGGPDQIAIINMREKESILQGIQVLKRQILSRFGQNTYDLRELIFNSSNVRFLREILVGNDSKKFGYMDAINSCVTNPDIDC